MTTVATTAVPGARTRLRAVALPSEHGGWGLTAEPALLGLLVAPSIAGGALALAAAVAFVARTPAKLALVDRRRGRRLPRTVLAERVAVVEGVALLALVVAAVLTADAPFWAPLLVAAPLVAVEAAYDIRSRGRRLVPELAGAAAVSTLAAMIVLADGGPSSLAAGVTLVLVARVATAVPHVRALVGELHGRRADPGPMLLGDLAAVGIAVVAAVVDRAVLAGAVAVVVLVVLHRLIGRRPPSTAVALGVRQLVLGLVLVVVTAVGVHVAT